MTKAEKTRLWYLKNKERKKQRLVKIKNENNI